MAVESNQRAGARIVTVTDPLTIHQCDALRAAFQTALDGGERRFVFDLRGAPHMDSASIGELVRCLKRVRENGGALKLVLDPDGKIRHILELSQLIRAFEVFPDQDDALASFAP